MELRQFAEQVLFSANLDEKLSCPDAITDENPGSPVAVPDAPGRPATLSFKKNNKSNSEFPGAHELENQESRSRLLHFFANHELLATELMALVLLKFPDAPAAFRKGVLQTLRDEQAHTRMYLKRMRDCGMEFGELPVSGYFWRSVSPMAHPIDYVSSLCLTFEQANLDFSKHFAEVFKTVGDDVSSKLMDKIYHDEIGHVAYGLKWFRRWKDPAQTDWDAFCRQLKFPLSPQRAKGFSINVAGREAAGLEKEFIDQLSVYSQSRGRTPNVYLFNPLAEGFVAHGPAFQAGKKQIQLASDLENLSQFLCRKDDVVLVQKKPSNEFLRSIQRAGIELPEFIELKEGRIDPSGDLLGRKLNDVKPWALSPDCVELLKPLTMGAAKPSASARLQFDSAVAELYSKNWSAELLRACITEHDENALFCDSTEIGVSADSYDDALRAVELFRSRGCHKLVTKEAIGVAGSNAIRLWEPEILDAQKTWIQTAIDRGSELTIEPWLDRVADYSIQLEMTHAGLKVLGYTGLRNDPKGQFKGNWAEPNYRKKIPATVLSSFDSAHQVERSLRDFYGRAFTKLESELRQRNFVGALGVDAFVYRNDNGNLRVKPIVEINPRYSMGRLTIELMKHVAPGSRGEFRILNQSDLKRAGFGDFESFAAEFRKRHPIIQAGQPKPKISQGAICLNDPKVARAVLAVFEVAPIALLSGS